MTWVKLDDQFFTRAKAQRASKDGRALYLAGLCFCAANLTDGLITSDDLRFVAAAAEVRPVTYRKLIEVGLWEEHPEGFLVHDYLDYNPSAEQVKAERERDRERKQEERKRGGKSSRSPGGHPPGRPPEISRSPEVPSPSPSPSPLNTVSPNNLSVVPDEGETDSKGLERRLVGVCTGNCRAKVWTEAAEVVALLRQHLADHVIDEAIGYCGTLRKPPVMPRYLLEMMPTWGAERGVTVPEMKLESA